MNSRGDSSMRSPLRKNMWSVAHPAAILETCVKMRDGMRVKLMVGAEDGRKYDVTGLMMDEIEVLLAGLGDFKIKREGTRVYAIVDKPVVVADGQD